MVISWSSVLNRIWQSGRRWCRRSFGEPGSVRDLAPREDAAELQAAAVLCRKRGLLGRSISHCGEAGPAGRSRR